MAKSAYSKPLKRTEGANQLAPEADFTVISQVSLWTLINPVECVSSHLNVCSKDSPFNFELFLSMVRDLRFNERDAESEAHMQCFRCYQILPLQKTSDAFVRDGKALRARVCVVKLPSRHTLVSMVAGQGAW